jgi:hypothetical protein
VSIYYRIDLLERTETDCNQEGGSREVRRSWRDSEYLNLWKSVEKSNRLDARAVVNVSRTLLAVGSEPTRAHGAPPSETYALVRPEVGFDQESQGGFEA